MKHKVAELEGALLDAAVAKATGRETAMRSDGLTLRDLDSGPSAWIPRFSPSTDWAHAGPIIERERIGISPGINDMGWWARSFHRGADKPPNDYRGSTPLIAAMRAYVASKLGGEVDLPT